MRQVLLTEPAVKAEGLILGYGGTIAVDRSTFSIPQGHVVAVIGPNGSGKSTLLNAIAGLIKPMAGAVEVPARRNGDHRISYVLQTTKVNDNLPVSVREVVTMGRYGAAGMFRRLSAADREAVEAAMERVGVTDLAGKPCTTYRAGSASGSSSPRVWPRTTNSCCSTSRSQVSIFRLPGRSMPSFTTRSGEGAPSC